MEQTCIQPNGAQHNVPSMDPKPLISVPLSHSLPPHGLAPAEFDNHLTLTIGLNHKPSIVKRLLLAWRLLSIETERYENRYGMKQICFKWPSLK